MAAECAKCMMVTETCGVCSGTERDEQGNPCEECAGVEDKVVVACTRPACANYNPTWFPPVSDGR